ncbi:hypothetical protein G3576_04560 [Roseomonas stagni]|uniref:Uncharacterized protein n=1 Tax=Falsiroseomonas algicola TaxID=2716930 RepID=A0A6M1LG33_9PROT|nr:hypothetical protein [Falsiroseomonas algicola]NGM19275.1 hypothetical protein [Falsiroseomonas algicola]
MSRSMLLASMVLALAPAGAALAQTPADFAGWPVLERRFESTGGGGWIIDDYDPVRIGAECRTDFTAVSPTGERILNTVVFDAVPVRGGGVLCTNGRWRGRDGSGAGTTPLRVFIRADGARFRSP